MMTTMSADKAAKMEGGVEKKGVDLVFKVVLLAFWWLQFYFLFFRKDK
jgi:hypothetical protein